MNLNKCFWCSKELNETALLSTQNIYYDCEIRKLFSIMHSYLEACNALKYNFAFWNHKANMSVACLNRMLVQYETKGEVDVREILLSH